MWKGHIKNDLIKSIIFFCENATGVGLGLVIQGHIQGQVPTTCLINLSLSLTTSHVV